ncbi:MAG: hypothetical protein V4539_01070 [Bacteroidota bacterium]
MARITKNNIAEFQEKLLDWHSLNGRHFFPWRRAGLTTYELVVAEILLQRTRAETVSNFYKAFLLEFPSWQSLANASLSSIEDFLKPIGLYRQRASRLQMLAVEMVKRNGEIPSNRQELESIPFMGQYIANAVELLVFNQASPLLDVNMSRVIERFFRKRMLSDIRYDPYLQKLATKITSHPKSKEMNWAVLDFAAMICKAHKPLCLMCPLARKCAYYQAVTMQPEVKS